MTGQKRLDELFSDAGGPLAALARAARRTDALTRAVVRALPPEFEPQVRSASLDEAGVLRISTGSPPWAARLRFEAPGLIAALRDAGIEVERVETRVRPPDGGGAASGQA